MRQTRACSTRDSSTGIPLSMIEGFSADTSNPGIRLHSANQKDRQKTRDTAIHETRKHPPLLARSESASGMSLHEASLNKRHCSGWLGAPHVSFGATAERNSSRQTPSCREVPTLNTPNPQNRCWGKRRADRFLSLELLWNLEFGIWNFLPALSASQELRRAPV